MGTKRNGSYHTHGPHVSYVPVIVRNIGDMLLATEVNMVQKSQISRSQQFSAQVLQYVFQNIHFYDLALYLQWTFGGM